ncbi:PREDICTED: uncharacterized protein LOC109487619 [Branchiostoma belcheri]|uniref:Uncharacterized protein LOC109487619 n=1 Tax=Branchiostoma belcheri TaxID=7741 RepID=A0A6P5AVR1_BRABE|nr:PREDICTED: uncharacterized protein LOC109487619 [Branchiostoma belcheri]
MQVAGKRILCLATSLIGKRSVMKLVRPPTGLPGVLLNSLHQDTPGPLTGPARNAHYNPAGQTGLSPADIGLLVGGGTIIGLGLYETYKNLCTAKRAPVAPDIGETVVDPEHEYQAAAGRGLNLLSTTMAERSQAGVFHRAVTGPTLLENVSKTRARNTGEFQALKTKAKDATDGSKSDGSATPTDEVPASAHCPAEKGKKPKRSARGKGGILYSSIDELESESMLPSVQQLDLVVEKHAGDRQTAILEVKNTTKQHKSSPMASNLSASPPSSNARGHVSQEAEDERDGVFQGCAGSLADGDNETILDGSGDHAGVKKDQEHHKSPSQHNSGAECSSESCCCCHDSEEATSTKAKRKHRYAVAKMDDNDDIHTTHAGKFEDHESDCECDLDGSTVKDNKMAASHVVIILS